MIGLAVSSSSVRTPPLRSLRLALLLLVSAAPRSSARLEERLMPEATDGFRDARQPEAPCMLATATIHDLNNLLTVIVAASDMLSRLHPTLSREALRHVSEIQDAAELGATLTHSVRTLLRRGTPAPLELVHIDDVVLRSLSLLRALAGRTIEIETRLTAHPVAVRGRALRIQQLLLNLVVNSRNAMPRGGVIRIETAVVEHGGERRLALRVHDTGVGMSDEVQAQIFEWGFTTRPETGLGVGLALARTIVEEHGGSIRVQSKPGHFTTFTVLLPIADPAK
jgi:signal transduction histidine kinase